MTQKKTKPNTKIQQNSPSLSKVVADNFGVNQNTVHDYIKDAAPVSRSQAKRVSNRLERFKEVIFEFMPINMNEPVTKMYQHVTSESR